MRALCWNGINDLSVEDVPDPEITNSRDVVLRVKKTTTCGSDLHFIDGYLPSMREGDVIGHEFMGEVAEVDSEVNDVEEGDRVVVPSFIGCGNCFYCQSDQWSLCDNTNPNAELQELFPMRVFKSTYEIRLSPSLFIHDELAEHGVRR